MTNEGVLRSRLRPPRIPGGAVSRPSLVEMCLRGIDHGRLVIVAGAGYGKSTLLAEMVAGLSIDWAWCSCDRRTASPAALLAHLVAGIAVPVPGFGAELALGGDAESMTSAFCNELDLTVSDDMVLILDDLHLLEGTDAATVVGVLFADLPPGVRLVVAGRSIPREIPERGTLTPGVVLMDERHLAMTPAEAKGLLLGAGLAAGADEVLALHGATEGWVAGLLIAAQAGEASLDGLPAIERDRLFAYLTSEVISRVPPATARFLEETSILTRFTPPLASAVSGLDLDETNRVLRELVDRRLFTQRIAGSGEWFRYHHLLAAHLRERLATDGPERVIELHRRAADAWREAGDWLEALRHLAATGDLVALADALDETTGAGLLDPHAPELPGWIESIPMDLRARRPGLLLAHATLLNTQGEFERAFASTDAAIERLIDLGEHDRAAVVLVRLLLNMLASGTPPARRIASGARCLPRLEPTPALPVARIAHAAGLAFGGDTAEARRQLDQAITEAPDSPYPVEAYARAIHAFYLDYPAGRGERAAETLDQVSTELLGEADRDPFGYGMYAAAYLPYVLNSLGRYEDALAATERCMTVFRAGRIAPMGERVSRWWRLTALAGLERWEELADEMVPPARALSAGESTHYGYRYRAPAALLAAHLRDTDAVAAHARAARDEMRSHGTAFDQPWILCDLSSAARSVGLIDLAVDLAEEARRGAVDQALPWGQARSALRLAVALGPGERGDAMLLEALRITDRETFTGLWSRRERGVAGEALAWALAAGIGSPEHAARLAVACGPATITECARELASADPGVRSAFAREAAATPGVPADVIEALLEDRAPDVRAAAHAARPPTPSGRPALGYRLLGGLSVERDRLPVARAAFGREKARALLAALLCADGPVHREVILEWLWPELDLERGMRAFHVTLHALRRALEPELPRRAPSSVVLTDGEAYRLVLREGDTFDVAAFLRLAEGEHPGEDLEDRLARLLEAESHATGEMLPEWPYAPWAETTRRHVEQTHRATLAALGRALLESGRAREAVARCRRLVELEEEREEWHRLLMEAYAQAGERALALRQYHACRAILRREIGIEPGAETRDLYREILSAEDLVAGVDGEPDDAFAEEDDDG